MRHLVKLSLLRNPLVLSAAFACLLMPLPALAESGITGTIAEVIFWICTRLGGMVLLLGATMLDGALWYLVIKMGDWFTNPNGLGAAVNLGWTLIRDVLNMCFIFGLIYIGIKTILNSEDSGTRKALGYLIAAALMINFSLFITQSIVDFSNLASVQLYSQMVSGNTPSGTANAAATSPIATKFMSAIGLSSFLSTETLKSDQFKGNLFLFSFLLLVFFVLAGIAFMLGAILIVTRFVALLLYMVFSPLMFIGWILPSFQSLATSWWKGFFKYVIFAPVYIFLIYISIAMLTGLMQGISGVPSATGLSFADSFNSKQLKESAVLLTMNFVIMIGLLWASLKVGDKLSLAGSNMVMGGLGAAQGFAYRNTVGRGVDYAIKKGDKTDFVPESVRRLMVKTRDYGAGGTGYTDAEKRRQGKINDKTTRRQQRDRSNTLKTDLEAGNFSNMSEREILSFAKDEKTRGTLLKQIGSLPPSAIKAIEKDKDVPDTFIAELKNKQNENIQTRIKAGDFEGVAKLLKNDPKELAKAAGKDIDNYNMAKYLVDNPSIINELGKHINDVNAMSGLKKKIQNVASTRGASVRDGVDKIITNSRTWI